MSFRQQYLGIRFRMNDLLLELGWQPHFESQVNDSVHADYVIGRVAAHFGNRILLLTAAGEISIDIQLLATSAAADAGYSDIAVGDWFVVEPETYRAIQRLERKTTIVRKAAGDTVKRQLIAANVDTVLIVSSCNQDFNLSRLERCLTLVLQSGATPVIVLTKRDLHDDPTSLGRKAESLYPGLVVETMDARNSDETECLLDWCKSGQTIALIGSSGVGKSTIANTLAGKEISTQSVRVDDDKGRHTTTARSMYRLKNGGWLIDNPGMREIQLSDCEYGIEDLFADVLTFASECRFRDCRHDGDAGCAIEAAIEHGDFDPRRLTSYKKLQSEQRRNTESLADRRERDRAQGRFYKKVISDKKQRRRS